MDSDLPGPVAADTADPFESVRLYHEGLYMETISTKPLLVLALDNACAHILLIFLFFFIFIFSCMCVSVGLYSVWGVCQMLLEL